MRREIRSHTALRGIAALLVMFLHYRFMAAGVVDVDKVTQIFAQAFVCVDLFFMLSGFIMCHVYADTLRGASWRDVRQYLVNRLARIYPLHVVTVFVMVLFIALHRPLALWEWRDLGLNLMLMQTWFLQSHFSFNAPNWSISAEWMAYLLFPFLLRFDGGWRFVIAGTAFFVAGYGLFHVIKEVVPEELHQKASLLRALPSFVMGMVLFRLAPHVATLGGKWVTVLQLGALAGVLGTMHVGAPLAVMVLPMAVLVLSTASDRGIMRWLLDGRGLRYLGEISYSVYLIHLPVMLWVLRWFEVHQDFFSDPWQAFAVFVGCVVTTLVLSAVSYRYLERPARSYIRAWPDRGAVRSTGRAGRG